MTGPGSKQLLLDLFFIALPAALAMVSSFYQGITAGNASGRLYFEEPPINRAAFYASAAAWVILLTGLTLFAAGLKDGWFARRSIQI